MDVLSQLDLVFCVDLTGSMASFIQTARTQMLRVLDALRAELGDGLRVAIVGYRDHCDGPRLLETQPLTTELDRIREVVMKLVTDGGGDAPEAVFSGLAHCLELDWAKRGYRVVLLVGDAPPHACGALGDSYAGADPSGFTLDDMANTFEAEGIFVHALAMNPHDKVLERCFQRLSISTGGRYHDARTGDAAFGIVEVLTQTFLEDIEFDRRLYERLQAGVEVPMPKNEDEVVPTRAEILSKMFGVSVGDIHRGAMRLRQRRLIDGLE